MSDAPHYSVEPGLDEKRLGITTRSSSAPRRASGTIKYKGDDIAIVLRNQQEGARCATYGRNAIVEGDVFLPTSHHVTHISSVVLKLEGTITAALGSNRVMPEVRVLDVSSVLWQEGGTSPCPSSIPFSIPLPATFSHDSSTAEIPLPPSYSTFGGPLSLKGLYIRCIYRVTALLVCPRWQPNKSLTVDIEYAPRTVPPRPIMHAPFPFAETILSDPDEWRQASALVPSKPPSTLEPIACQLFTPSVNIFTKRAAIPFFLQLRATSASILALHGHAPGANNSYASTEPGLARRLLHTLAHADGPAEPRITVSVEREVTAQLGADAQDAGYAHAIGSSALRPVPPRYQRGAQDTLDFEGEIRLDEDLVVGGFDAGVVKVKDFVVLSVQLVGPARSHFADLSQSYPVRIVTG